LSREGKVNKFQCPSGGKDSGYAFRNHLVIGS